MPEPTPSYPFVTDWNKIARLIVHDSLKTQPGERVILHVDPTYFPELTEQVRIEIVNAGAVEVGALLRDSPGLHATRRRLRRREIEDLRQLEDAAIGALFDISDIYIWLPTSWNMAWYQTEWILTRWKGRSVHFHWITDVIDPAVFQAFSEQYVRALFIDYAKLDARQNRLIDALRGNTVRVTDARGSDFQMDIAPDAHFHHGNGNASREFIEKHSRPGSARDREVELPCGLVRTVDVSNPRGQLIVPNQFWGDRFVGTMKLKFNDGRLTEMSTEMHNDWVQRRWEEESGDKDRVGEINIGTNPELKMIPGISDIPYYGYGEGILRIDIGSNWESGGKLRSTSFRWLAFTNANLEVKDKAIIRNGQLVLP